MSQMPLTGATDDNDDRWAGDANDAREDGHLPNCLHTLKVASTILVTFSFCEFLIISTSTGMTLLLE